MGQALSKAVRELHRTFADAFNSYRPELHYMRGPGPKWHAKRHGITPAPRHAGAPAAVADKSAPIGQAAA